MLTVVFETFNHRWIRKSAQYTAFFVVLIFLVAAILKNWQQIASYDWQVDYFLLTISLVLIILTTMFGATTWALILTGFSQRLSLIQLIAIWLLSQIAKYMPGGIWNLVGRAYLCQQGGLPMTEVILSLLLEIGLYLVAQFFIILLLGSFTVDFLFGDSYYLFLGILISASVVIIHPRILRKSVQLLARLKGKEIDLPLIEQKKMVGFLALYIAFTALGGITFYTFISSIHRLPLSTLPAIIVIVTISFVISFLSPLAPNGLGVREGIFSLLLSQFIPLPVAIVIAFAARVWLIVGEILSAGLGALLKIYASSKDINRPQYPP